jgi:ATP-dependent exoDNAse (exonuclease V) alpha subunit
MAIYHFSAQVISRGRGQSAVASASYRSGDRLMDERTGEEKFYRRDVAPDTMILTPSNAPEWTKDRGKLWNAVEQIEKRKDAQLAREINIALPVELSKNQQKELIQNYVQEQFVNRGMVADIAIHRDESANPHAHVMLTIRPLNENGEWGNKKRKEYELEPNGNKVLDDKGKPKYKTHSLTDWDKKETLEQWREQWANHANKALEREGIQERISHLSHEARGLEQLPTVHLGHVANEMEKRGVPTDRGNINRDRQEYNALVVAN